MLKMYTYKLHHQVSVEAEQVFFPTFHSEAQNYPASKLQINQNIRNLVKTEAPWNVTNTTNNTNLTLRYDIHTLRIVSHVFGSKQM